MDNAKTKLLHFWQSVCVKVGGGGKNIVGVYSVFCCQNFFPANCHLYHLLITFVNSLDPEPDQALQNNLDPN